MSTINATPTTKRQDLREDTMVTAYARTWDFYDKNKGLVVGAGVALVVLIAALIGFGFMQQQRGVDAQSLLAQALPAYETGRYQEALDGSDAAPGLLEVIREYGSSDAGNLAAFYAADAYFRLGQYDEALRYFDQYDVDDSLVGASALSGQAKVHEIQGNFDRAGDLYRRAAQTYEDPLTSPVYLMQAGRAYEKAAAFGQAQAAYELLLDAYPEATQAAEAQILSARAAAQAS
ncbi:MAG: hypothetical protein AAGI71_18610 [Bacteroidota bacterium]